MTTWSWTPPHHLPGSFASFDRWVPPPEEIYRYEILYPKNHGPWKMFFSGVKHGVILAIYLFVKFQGTNWEYVCGGRGRSFFGGKKNIHLNLESGFHKQLPKQLNSNFSYLERWKGSLSQKYLWHLLCPWQWWPFEKDANSARTSWSYLVFFYPLHRSKRWKFGSFFAGWDFLST